MLEEQVRLAASERVGWERSAGRDGWSERDDLVAYTAHVKYDGGLREGSCE